MYKISVIVPAYNIEEYIGKCIDSLANQTFNDIEIIIVNDGSKDNTEDVIKKRIAEYPDKNIILYTKENGGLSDARNFGISKATGEYIAFLDGDDYVEPDMFYEMNKKIEEYSYDVIACDVNCRYPDKDMEIKSGIGSDKRKMTVKDKEELILNAYVVVWNKIYKRELFTKDKLFMKGIWFEDVLFSYKIFPFINSIGVVNKKLCNYIQRENSITYTYNEKLYDINKVMKELKKFYEENNIFDEYKDILEYEYVRYMFGTFIKRIAKSKDKVKFNEGVNFVLEDVKKSYPNYKQNRFIKMGGGKNIYLRNFNKFFAKIIYITEKNKMN